MGEPLDELYFPWLYEKVADPGIQDSSLSYWEILKVLYTKEFVWVVANDENRILDGKELRRSFIRDQGISGADPNWAELGCSVLEVMVGLSERLAFMLDGLPHYWFWVLMNNLNLGIYNDSCDLTAELGPIDDILETFIWRQYQFNGDGGLFPLKNPSEDQRQIELWYQLSAYVNEIMEE